MIKRDFSLKDISQMTGIRTNRLRVWKNRYGILKPVRKKGKTHYYSHETLRFIMKVSRMLEEEYRISEVLEMSEQEMNDRLESLVQQRDRANRRRVHDQMMQALLQLQPERLDDLYRQALERYGFSDALDLLLLPLLQKLGTLWEVGTIHSVHEHLFSNFVRRKLMAAVDRIEPKASRPEVLLFLPNQELHEIPLLYIHYQLLHKKAHPVFLGGSVPYEDLRDYLQARTPEMAVSYLTYTGDLSYHQESFPRIARNFPRIAFYFGVPNGPSEGFETSTVPGNMHCYEQREEMMADLFDAIRGFKN